MTRRKERRLRRRRERRRLRPSFSADLLPQRSARSREICRGRGATPLGRGRPGKKGGVSARLARPPPPCSGRSSPVAAYSGPRLPLHAELPSSRRDRDAQAAGSCPLPFLPCPQGRHGGERLKQPFLWRNRGARLREPSLQTHHGGAHLRQLPVRGAEGGMVEPLLREPSPERSIPSDTIAEPT